MRREERAGEERGRGAIRAAAGRWYWIVLAALAAVMFTYVIPAAAAENSSDAVFAVFSVYAPGEGDLPAQRLAASNEAAEAFADVLGSEVLLDRAVDSASLSVFNGTVAANVIPGSNLVELSVYSADTENARRLIDAIIGHHAEISAYVLADAEVEAVCPAGTLPQPEYEGMSFARALLTAMACAAAVFVLLVLYYEAKESLKAADRKKAKVHTGKEGCGISLSGLVRETAAAARGMLRFGICLVVICALLGMIPARGEDASCRATARAAVVLEEVPAEGAAASRQLRQVFTSLLRSDYLRGMVSRELGRTALPQVEVAQVGSTNLVELTVEAETLPEAREALEALIRMFPAAAEPVVGESRIVLLDEYGVSCEKVERPGPAVCAAAGAAIGAVLWLMAAAAKAVREKEAAESGSVEELLGRSEVRVDAEEIGRALRGKTVLVTGGGGSIGSELCRQIALHGPRKLVIFDIYENNAYDLEQELRQLHPGLDLEVVIGSVRDRKRVEEVFERFRPQLVCHAAAHKHVPLMEASPREAVKNNVFGTLHVAEAAGSWGAEKFILISSDKAVNPTSVMGATKRVCEGIVRALGEKWGTVYAAVRFGNVLRSGGSVIPLFQSQIERGGPVTVTHREARRYFMTVSEAVSLVLQACAYARGGETFVLDMGEPVCIDELARAMIRRAGLVPERDIPIVYTGLRPGEKLVEELRLEGEQLEATPNRRIFSGRFEAPDPAELKEGLEELRELCEAEDGAVREALFRLARGSCPQQAGAR